MSDANIVFIDLVNLLKYFGFDMRVKGSHHIFRKAEVQEKVNLQKEGNKAKPYQVDKFVILFSNINWEIKANG